MVGNTHRCVVVSNSFKDIDTLKKYIKTIVRCSKKCETISKENNKKVSHFQKVCYNKNVKQNVRKSIKKFHIYKGGKYGRKNRNNESSSK